MSTPRPRGPLVEGWTAPQAPKAMQLDGRYVRLEPLDPARHAAPLFHAFDGCDEAWDYMPVGPFTTLAPFQRWMQDVANSPEYVFFALHDLARGSCGGVASFLRIQPAAGSIEVGYIAIAPQMQRSTAATEAMYLMMRWAFQAGYRRYEWKCDALNLPSRRAAQRLGFSYEGVFRQATVVKGRNRDTAWFAVIDSEWPALDQAFRRWLAPSNFDAKGRQRAALSDLTRPLRAASDPALPTPAG